MSSVLEQLRAMPRDRELHLVYADELQARGDPQGELILVQDAAARTGEVDAYHQLRQRARAIYEAHPRLQLGDWGGEPRRLWPRWERGFVRHLELDFYRTWRGFDPQRSEWERWTRRLSDFIEHPCLALLESLTIHLHTAPLGMLGKDRALVRGLERLRERGRPRLRFVRHHPHAVYVPSLIESLFAVSSRVQDAGEHERMAEPAGERLRGLVRALAGAERVSVPCELVWFDAQGRFYGVRHEAGEGDFRGWQNRPTGGMAHELAMQDAAFVLDPGDPLVERRIARFLDGYAMRLDPVGRSGAPRLAWTTRPARTSVKDGFEGLAWAWADRAGPIERALEALESDYFWFVLKEAMDSFSTEDAWYSLLGLADGQLLCLSLLLESPLSQTSSAGDS